MDMLSRRFRYILDASFNCDESDAPSMTNKLDLMERRLYEEVKNPAHNDASTKHRRENLVSWGGREKKSTI